MSLATTRQVQKLGDANTLPNKDGSVSAWVSVMSGVMINLVNSLGLTIEGQCALLVASVVSLGRLIQEPVYSLAPLNRGPGAG